MTRGRIVVFRPGALGDTIVAADALAALRSRYPDDVLELVGNAPAARLLLESGLVDIATSFDSPDVAALFAREPRVAAQWAYARVVTLWLSNAEGMAQAFRAAGAQDVVSAGPHPRRPAGGSHDQAEHVSDYLVDMLRPLGVSRTNGGPTLLKAPPSGRTRPAGHTALLHPGSGSTSKNWPADRFAELAGHLIDGGWTVRLLRGPADGDAVQTTRALIGGELTPVEETPDLTALAARVAETDLYVGNDSGVSHLSGRLGTFTVSIFGPTDPRQWAPRGPHVAVIGGNGTWPTVTNVWDAALLLLASGGRDPAGGDID